MRSMLRFTAIVALLGLGPARASAAPQGGAAVGGSGEFASVVAHHVERTIGTAGLPSANGTALRSGVFLTVGLEHFDVFDREVVLLQAGRVRDPVPADACMSGCASVLFDALRFAWLELAVEAVTLGVGIPALVHVAAHRDVPAETTLQIAYAAAETRPVAPPRFSLVVDSGGRGLRAQEFFLVPPAGLELQQGSAALALTVRASPENRGFEVQGADPLVAVARRVPGKPQLRSLLAALKKSNPGKDTIILVPDAAMTTGELVELIVEVRTVFTRVVLSLGQRVVV